MKKLFFLLVAGGFLFACNDSGTTESTPEEDSTRLPNTLSPADTTTIPVDSPRRAADTVIKK